MKLSEFKESLNNVNSLEFVLPNGQKVPDHFHVTEVGQITKNFIDCGGTIRQEQAVSFQLLDADDHDHRLKPQKLMKIITLSENILKIGDHEIEVEYQSDTIGKYGILFIDGNFILTRKTTACLAADGCAPEMKLNVQSKCTPGAGCC